MGKCGRAQGNRAPGAEGKAMRPYPGKRTRDARRAVVYARVSSKEQEKEGFSIPAQRRLLDSYARENGISVAREFVDVETAKQAGRTGFGEMIAFLRAAPNCRVL